MSKPSYETYNELREAKGVKDADVAREANITKSTFSEWKSGRSYPKQEKLQRIATYLNVPLPLLYGEKPVAPIPLDQIPAPRKDVLWQPLYDAIDEILSKATDRKEVKKIPVLGRVAAGIPIEAAEEIIDWEEITEDMAITGEFFGLQIKGDSMEPKFSDGDVVIVRQQSDADDGDIVIAMVNSDDAVCKKLKKYQDGIALVSTNPAYEPLYFTNEEIEKTPIKIIGKVKELRAKF